MNRDGSGPVKGALRWLPWFIFGVTISSIGLAIYIAELSEAAGLGGISLADKIWGVSWLGLPLMGTVIAWKRPESRVGWLACVFALPIAALLVASEYSKYALEAVPGQLPAAEFMFWLAQWPMFVAGGIGIMTFLLFPNGHLPSRRWKWVAALAMTAAATGALSAAFGPVEFEQEASIENPYLVSAVSRITEQVQQASGTVLMGLVLVSLLSTLVRIRRSTGVERQQIKWLMFGLAWMLANWAGVFVIEEILGNFNDEFVTTLMFVSGVLGPPAGIGVALLRYRLYEIDRVINRSVVYLFSTVLLIAAYLGLVLLMQTILGPLRGDSDLAIVVSTLAVAAGFNPLRRRIQRFVDRRFYRRRYDAQRTIEDFSSRLRDEIDLQEIHLELTQVLGHTMQPASSVMWLVEPNSKS